MKVYISVDMEGIAGVVAPDQVGPGQRDYERFRRIMTQEANAAARGAFDGGATDVWINDSHGPMTNIVIEDLDPRVQLISGVYKPLLQVEGIDQGFGALFFVGYHQREGGGNGVLNHTLLGRTVYEVRVNGDPVDEAALNAAVAGVYGVPVALVAGDSELCADAERRFSGVVTAPTKVPIDRFAARSLTPEKARELIRERAVEAMDKVRQGHIAPYTVQTPVTIEVDFKRTAPATMTSLIPTVERIGPRTIAIKGDDYIRTFKTFVAAAFLGLHSMEGGL